MSELLLSAFADRPPYRQTHGLLPGCQATCRSGFRMCSVLAEKHGCRDQAELLVADECTWAAAPDGHSGVHCSREVYTCQLLFWARAEFFRMATRRHEKSQESTIGHKKMEGSEGGTVVPTIYSWAAWPRNLWRNKSGQARHKSKMRRWPSSDYW